MRAPTRVDARRRASARASASKIEEVSIFGDARRPTPAAVGLYSEGAQDWIVVRASTRVGARTAMQSRTRAR